MGRIMCRHINIELQHNRSGHAAYMNYEVGYNVVLEDSQEIGLLAEIRQAANSNGDSQIGPHHLRSVALIKHNSVGVEV
jgi:hypothetical protein